MTEVVCGILLVNYLQPHEIGANLVCDPRVKSREKERYLGQGLRSPPPHEAPRIFASPSVNCFGETLQTGSKVRIGQAFCNKFHPLALQTFPGKKSRVMLKNSVLVRAKNPELQVFPPSAGAGLSAGLPLGSCLGSALCFQLLDHKFGC